MVKKLTSIRIEPNVIKKLKYLSVKYERPLGEIIEGLVNFSESGKFLTDPKEKKTFESLLKYSILQTGNRSTWVQEDESEDDATNRLINERKEQFRKDMDAEKDI